MIILSNVRWHANARIKLRKAHQIQAEEMYDGEIYPIWISGDDIRFPGDDAMAPSEQAANDREFTIVGC